MRLKGDVNNDGKINLVDMVLIRKSILGVIKLSEEDFNAADVNGDGVINISDLIRVRNHINGAEIINEVIE